MQTDLKILYLQIREDALTRQEELDEFVRYSGLNAGQFTVLNVFDTPRFEPTVIAGHDSVFVGGSSDASVLHNDPFVNDSKKMLLYSIEQSIPVFASCFGFQIAVEAMGGQVVLDKAHMEMGTYQLYLTPEARQDTLFHDTPDNFWAISGHKERALVLPENVILLAYSDLCPYHAFKLKDKPFYAFQFHPEVNDVDLVNRITRYQERYLDDESALQNIVQTMRPTPESNGLVGKFVQRIMLADRPSSLA